MEKLKPRKGCKIITKTRDIKKVVYRCTMCKKETKYDKTMKKYFCTNCVYCENDPIKKEEIVVEEREEYILIRKSGKKNGRTK